MNQSIMNKIIRFVVSKTNPADSAVKTNDLLFEKGILDSFSALELITFLENEFHIHLSSDEISKENFMSIETIAQLIETKIKK